MDYCQLHKLHYLARCGGLDIGDGQTVEWAIKRITTLEEENKQLRSDIAYYSDYCAEVDMQNESMREEVIR